MTRWTAACNPTSITLTVYPLSTSCSGPSEPNTMPAGQCLQDASGSFFENFCNLLGLLLRGFVASQRRGLSCRCHCARVNVEKTTSTNVRLPSGCATHSASGRTARRTNPSR